MPSAASVSAASPTPTPVRGSHVSRDNSTGSSNQSALPASRAPVGSPTSRAPAVPPPRPNVPPTVAPAQRMASAVPLADAEGVQLASHLELPATAPPRRGPSVSPGAVPRTTSPAAPRITPAVAAAVVPPGAPSLAAKMSPSPAAAFGPQTVPRGVANRGPTPAISGAGASAPTGSAIDSAAEATVMPKSSRRRAAGQGQVPGAMDDPNREP